MNPTHKKSALILAPGIGYFAGAKSQGRNPLYSPFAIDGVCFASLEEAEQFLAAGKRDRIFSLDAAFSCEEIASRNDSEGICYSQLYCLADFLLGLLANGAEDMPAFFNSARQELIAARELLCIGYPISAAQIIFARPLLSDWLSGLAYEETGAQIAWANLRQLYARELNRHD